MSTPHEGWPELTQTHVFDLTRRGYGRGQVEDHVQTLLSELDEMVQAHQREHERAARAEAELESTRSQLEQRAARAEAELRSARSQLEQQGSHPTAGQDSDAHQGFGYRVEKLLRIAEHEAAEVRSIAAREATALLERAREEAEAHRQDVEQSLIARAAKLDQEAAQRKVELDERERLIAEQTAAAREEAERMLSEVERHAEQIHQDARARAEELRVRAEKAIRERDEAAEQELHRLRSLHYEVRGELGRLLESLAGEFDDTSRSRQPQPQLPPPQPPPWPASSHRIADQDPPFQDRRKELEDRFQAGAAGRERPPVRPSSEHEVEPDDLAAMRDIPEQGAAGDASQAGQ